MRAPQWRQRPLRRSQDRIGTLSLAPTGAPHSGHFDLGLTIDSPLLGRRWITTVRNEPTAAPSTPIRTTNTAMRMRLSRGPAVAQRAGDSSACRIAFHDACTGSRKLGGERYLSWSL